MISVAIIGHGSSIEGRGYGKFIDSNDIVIRMAECDWQNHTDYGIKYDIGVFAEGPSKSWAENSQRIPKLEYWYYRMDKNIRNEEDVMSKFKDRQTRELRNSVWQYVKHLKPGFHFSRGTAAVISAAKLYHPVEISLFGFDSVINGTNEKTGSKHHPDLLTQYLPSDYHLPRNGNTHDWESEKNLMQTLSSTKAVAILTNIIQ